MLGQTHNRVSVHDWMGTTDTATAAPSADLVPVGAVREAPNVAQETEEPHRMKTESLNWTVAEIIDEHEKGQLKPNREYQRGEVWKKHQEQLLIDSLLRGFHLPVFYFHIIQERGKFGINTRSEIIDGQQRVNAMVGFKSGDFALLDPMASDSRFPLHLRTIPCKWAGLSFDRLPSGLQEAFLESEVTVAQITEAGDNEARDLFVRLQSGADLNSQERRDAYPGEFCYAVAKIAGREGVALGHPLFQTQMGLKPQTDRGRTRQFVSQLIAIAISYGQGHVVDDVGKRKIDSLYYDHLELNEVSDIVNRLEGYLTEINERLMPWPRGLKVRNHLMIHLVLLWIQAESNLTNAWKSDMCEATQEFMLELDASLLEYRRSRQTDDMYNLYYTLTRNSSELGETIALRHAFFMDWLRSRVKFVQKDQKRGFDWIEREYVYLKSNGRCAYRDQDFCGDEGRMQFDQAAIHHVNPHAHGGRTDLSNAVLTHRACNTKIGANLVPPAKAYTAA